MLRLNTGIHPDLLISVIYNLSSIITHLGEEFGHYISEKCLDRVHN